MANICTTNYVIEGDKNELDALFQTMKEQEEKETSVEYPTGLMDLAKTLGANPSEFDCRGGWVELEYLDGVLRMTFETAWTPCFEVISLIKTKYPSLCIFYRAKEPGCDVYLKNDIDGKYFPETEVDGIPYTIMTEEKEQFSIQFIRDIWNGKISFQVQPKTDC